MGASPTRQPPSRSNRSSYGRNEVAEAFGVRVAGRCLCLAHLEYGRGIADIRHDPQPAETGEASVLRDAGVAICWRGTAAGMHGRDCDRLADF
jgi:hypothetical protein